jgi:glycosyl transferase family 25
MTELAWPILIVSLRDASARRAGIAAQMKAAGLPFEFVDAVDGRSGLPAAWEAKVDRLGTVTKHGYGMSDGEFACALSHQLIYRKILDEGLQGAVVLEDDAILTPMFAGFYRNRGYRTARFIQLFCYSARIWRGPGCPAAAAATRLYRLAQNPFASVGYSLSRSAAEYFANHSFPIRDRADWPIDLTQLGALLTVPSIIRHPTPNPAQSSLAADRSNQIPEGFDFSARYPKGWHRLVSASAWRRAVVRRLSRKIDPGY